MPSVSHSRADGFLLCRRKDYYAYTLGLQKVSDEDSMALGTAVHSCLEALYRHILAAGTTRRKQKAALKGGFQAMHERYLEIVKEGWEDRDDRMPLKEILRRYVSLEPFTRQGWLIIAVEAEYLLEYDPDTQSRFRFVIDLVAEDPEGKVAIIDHKTAYDFFKPEAANIQGQVPKYIGAMRGLGHKVHYGLYNELRTRKIRGEKKLKAQLVADLDKAGVEHHELQKSPIPAYIDVNGDAHEFVEELAEVPLSKLSVEKLTVLAKENGVDLYAGPTDEQVHDILYIRPSAARVIRTFEEQIGVAAEISARELLPVEVIEKSAYRTANKMVCQSCSFRDLCEAQLAGQSVKLLMQTEFKTKEKRDEIEVSEEVNVG
jgi:hypothetical protein